MIVSYSHGPDSRYLLDVLLRQTPPNQIILVYFDHGTRPEAKYEIMAIRRLSQELGVKCCIRRLPVTAYQSRFGVSFEAAAHRLRKSFLIHFSRLFQISDVILAHHLDDDIETMILKLFRGTGTHWRPFLHRMTAYGVTWCRPLLNIKKADIMAYLDEHHITYSVDSSNTNLEYSRNWMRHLFLPQVSRINENYQSALFNFFEIQRQQAIEITSEIDSVIERYCRFADGFVEFPKSALKLLPSYLISNLVLRLLEVSWAHFHRHDRILPPYWGISCIHVTKLREGLKSRVFGRFSLPDDMLAEWTQASFAILDPHYPLRCVEQRLVLDTPLRLSSFGIEVILTRRSSPSGAHGIHIRLPSDTTFLTLRPYLHGDRYTPKGSLVDRCVWKLMKTRHILPFLRSCLPLFFYKHQLLWGLGLVSVAEGVLKFDDKTVFEDFTIGIAPIQN